MNFDLAALRERFYLVFQPIMNAQSQIEKCEVLLRWDQSIINASPQQLIGWAEQDKKAIVMIDKMVLERLVSHLFGLSRDGYQLWPMRFAINVSPTTLGIDSDYLVMAEELISRLPTKMIEIEVLETKVHDSYRPRIKRALRRLDKMGVTLSIDDFGAGFDSITKMTEMGYSNIKIDGELVNGVHRCYPTQMVVASLVELAHKLDKTVTAEKVEHEEQFEVMKTIGCDYFQGYYFSKPLTLDEFLQFIDARPVQKFATSD